MTIRVTARYDEPSERLLQRFKRLCLRGGLFKEIKRRRFYEKPSQKRRREAKESLREAKKAERRELRARGARRRR